LSNEKVLPYVVSSDLKIMMDRWAEKHRYTLPEDSFFNSLMYEIVMELQTHFPKVEELTSDHLIAKLHELIQRSALPVISLDRAYIDENTPGIIGFFDATRSMKPTTNPSENQGKRFQKLGLGPRPDSASFDTQLQLLLRKLPQREVALADDWIFAGETNVEIIQLMAKYGIVVKEIISGVTVPQGKKVIESLGVKVVSVVEYDQGVIDGICSRDLFGGAPQSGRTIVVDEQTTLGAPYFLQFGDPVEWASIPESGAESFSEVCLQLTLALWEAIEKASKTEIPTDQLPKKIYGLAENASVTAAIRKLLLEKK
jgi:hypothetical protein